MVKFIKTTEDFKTLPGNRMIKRSCCPLELIPSEEFVINAMNESGKCFIHYHLFGGKIVTEEWDNTGNEITGPIFYNAIRNKQFVRDYHNRIEKIVVSVHDNPEI